MANDTKERILAAALEMFSQNGYAGTNIRELTASLGLVKSSMYKHFRSKEEIWNTLLDEMIAYYDDRFGSPEHLPPIPETLDRGDRRLLYLTLSCKGKLRKKRLCRLQKQRRRGCFYKRDLLQTY